MSYLITALEFLFSLLLNWISIIFLLAVILFRRRLWLSSNILYQLLSRFTRFVIKPFPWLVGGEKERVVYVAVSFVAQYLKVIMLIFIGSLPSLQVFGMLLLAVAFVFNFLVHIYVFSILILVLMSWFAQSHSAAHSPAVDILLALTEPVLRPLRRLLPPMGGMDFTPVIAMILLILSLLLIYNPIRDYSLLLR